MSTNSITFITNHQVAHIDATDPLSRSWLKILGHIPSWHLGILSVEEFWEWSQRCSIGSRTSQDAISRMDSNSIDDMSLESMKLPTKSAGRPDNDAMQVLTLYAPI